MRKQLKLVNDKGSRARAVTERVKVLVEAHNGLQAGVKLGVRKSQRKGMLDTPLFSGLAGEQQTLFG